MRLQQGATEEAVSSKVFVGNLTQDLTESDLRSFFEQYGPVSEVLIPRPFREFAFVTFDSDAVAKSLLGQHFTVKETNIVVMEATPKKKLNDRGDNRQNFFDNRGQRSRSPTNSGRGHYGNNNAGYYDNRQQQGFNNKRRRNDYDDWNNGPAANPPLPSDVLQAVVSKAVSDVLSGAKSIDPWNRHWILNTFIYFYCVFYIYLNVTTLCLTSCEKKIQLNIVLTF